MDKYINATLLTNQIDNALARTTARGNAKSNSDMAFRTVLGVTKQLIDKATKDGEVRPIVHSHWVFKYGNYICANCKNRSYDKEEIHWNHTGNDNVLWCPHCGALMDEPDED